MSQNVSTKVVCRQFVTCCVLLCVLSSAPIAGAKLLDFSDCVIVAPGSLSKVEQKAVAVLQEEIQKRTGITPQTTKNWPQDKAVIAVGPQSQISQFAGPLSSDLSSVVVPGAEGFYVSVRSEPRIAAVIVGKDSRGVLYGIGKLLRKMDLRTGNIRVPDGLTITTAPKYWLRGHQLGYRPKTNAYDAWSPAQYDQYIRELALFGTNAIEIIPPVSDDDYLSRHMKDPMEMMIRHSEIIDSYGLDVWIWYPNVGKDYVSE
ncbi:MAG: alpha-glucuronidase family glycosyl hydrolase, partial [Planctomycetota bacterium]